MVMLTLHHNTSGSKDSTVMVWDISQLMSIKPIKAPNITLLNVLRGHNHPVNAVAVDLRLDIVASASYKLVVLHTLRFVDVMLWQSYWSC